MATVQTDMHAELLEPDLWCALPDPDRRRLLAESLHAALRDAPGVRGARVQVGPAERAYDLVAVLETDVGDLRAPLWSHVRASIFCDASIHPANRRQIGPGIALQRCVDDLRRRLAVPLTLEARGASISLAPEDGVERTWTAERSRFRGKTLVTREDRVSNPPDDLDLRDLLAHFYTGPGLRLLDPEGNALLLPARAEPEDGPLVSLCEGCGRWTEGPVPACPHCRAPVNTVVAMRPARR